MGISINFGMIHRYMMINPNLCGLLGPIKVGNCLFFKNLFQIDQKVRNIFRFVTLRRTFGFFKVKF